MAAKNQCRDPETARRHNRHPARLRRSIAQRAGGARQPVRAGRCFFFGFALLVNLVAHAQSPEPEGYRMDDYRAPTPATVAGAVVLDTDTAHQLWKSGEAVWIDVLPAPRRPANLPQSAVV